MSLELEEFDLPRVAGNRGWSNRNEARARREDLIKFRYRIGRVRVKNESERERERERERGASWGFSRNFRSPSYILDANLSERVGQDPPPRLLVFVPGEVWKWTERISRAKFDSARDRERNQRDGNSRQLEKREKLEIQNCARGAIGNFGFPGISTWNEPRASNFTKFICRPNIASYASAPSTSLSRHSSAAFTTIVTLSTRV